MAVRLTGNGHIALTGAGIGPTVLSLRQAALLRDDLHRAVFMYPGYGIPAGSAITRAVVTVVRHEKGRIALITPVGHVDLALLQVGRLRRALLTANAESTSRTYVGAPTEPAMRQGIEAVVASHAIPDRVVRTTRCLSHTSSTGGAL
ncbi:hypothetical protein [Actinokineospora cianjurensis]|uniref:Uncharacterized protein n=1 Tax=Actinokineospora cianjurensis TaxID=585224 RepID=A0A421B291_9PSEU|nr:hypothetical protein [Actinokineospora cianjurensis]RLK58381.1 hypothetical protein CLV68_4480 [Actinokineospora cianjurensis]